MKDTRKRVVVVGAGFAGLKAVQRLKNAPVDVLLIDRNNYHLFQPLLYQVASAYLDPEQIAKPIRGIFHGQKNFSFRMAEVTGIRFTEQVLETNTGDITYDYLILAAGGQASFFGMDEVRRHGFALKGIGDGILIRNHLLTQFEQAAVESDPLKRRALLSVVIGGGGSAGVEMAGALAELVHTVLLKDYREFANDEFRVILCEASDKILPDLPADLAETAERILKKKKVEIYKGNAIADYDGTTVFLKAGEPIPACTLIWTAGIQAASLAQKLDLPLGANKRIAVRETLQVPEHDTVYAVGDMVYIEHEGHGVPMVAPAAVQMADAAVKNIRRAINEQPLKAFSYNDLGALATIGRNAAVANIKGIKFRGFAAWLVWLVVHLMRLVGFRNRIVVFINWAWDYFFMERASRAIAREGHSPSE